MEEKQHAADILAATTRKEIAGETSRDAVAQGQRRVNLIWEYTQALIAVSVVIANLVVGTVVGLNPQAKGEVPPMLTNALFLVVGFYFSRTNHTATGGVGRKAQSDQEYTGR